MRRKKRALASAFVAAVAALSVMSAGPAQGAPERGASPVAPDQAPAVKVVSSPAATSALETIQERIARHVAEKGTKYTFGSYVDGVTGKIVLETDAPARLVSELTDLSGADSAQRKAADRLDLRRASTSDTSRRDDTPPFYGAGGITHGGGICSSGYAVTNSAGARYMVTAGHCFANGVSVLTESGRYTYGTVSNRRLPTVTNEPVDMELMSGQTYAGRVFSGTATGADNLAVVGAGDATVGFGDYCHSGRTTGENCGHTANSVTAQVCTQTGCKSPVIAYTGGNLQQGGDSGGSFYVKSSTGGVWIRGHVIASGSGTGYVQPWHTVASTFGVNIVTS